MRTAADGATLDIKPVLDYLHTYYICRFRSVEKPVYIKKKKKTNSKANVNIPSASFTYTSTPDYHLLKTNLQHKYHAIPPRLPLYKSLSQYSIPLHPPKP